VKCQAVAQITTRKLLSIQRSRKRRGERSGEEESGEEEEEGSFLSFPLLQGPGSQEKVVPALRPPRFSLRQIVLLSFLA